MGENVMRAAVLMYHALYRDEAEYLAIDAEDRPYAVQFDEFVRQLDVVADMGFLVRRPDAADRLSAGDGRQVLLTFDDGHSSNYHLAFPELVRRGWSGLFLVTSDFMGNRGGFCSWSQLGEMSQGGMLIGSHGKTHRFLDALDDNSLEEEISCSNQEIARNTGVPVSWISFPGGRFDSRSIRIGRALGWNYFLTSRVGDNDPDVLEHGGVIRRLALRNSTSCAELSALLEGGSSLRRAELIESAKSLLRTLLGNRFYHALYRRLAAS